MITVSMDTDFSENTIREIEGYIKSAVYKEAERLRQLLLSPTKTWDHRVSITISPFGNGDIKIDINDDIYNLLDKGSPPRVLIAPTGKVFAFQRSTPKTQPYSLESRISTKSGPVIFTKKVTHYIRARHFVDTAVEEWSTDLESALKEQLETYFAAF